MSAQGPVDQTSPLWRAWEAYTQTAEYANTKRWAAHPEHAEGSLWAAFEQGFRASTSTTPLQREREAWSEYAITEIGEHSRTAWRAVEAAQRATDQALAALEEEDANALDNDVLQVLCRAFDDDPADLMAEWHAWYKPAEWLHGYRALGAFIGQRIRASQRPTLAEVEALFDEVTDRFYTADGKTFLTRLRALYGRGGVA